MSATSHSWNLINAAQPHKAEKSNRFIVNAFLVHFLHSYSNSSYKGQKVLSHIILIFLDFFFLKFSLPSYQYFHETERMW